MAEYYNNIINRTTCFIVDPAYFWHVRKLFRASYVYFAPEVGNERAHECII